MSHNLCRVKRSFKPYQNEHNSVKDTREKGKNPCKIDLKISMKFLSHYPPSLETQGQSVGSGEKAGRKFSGNGGRAPGYRLLQDHFQKFHPRTPRGSQSAREKRRDESFQVWAKEPLGTDSHRTISKNSSGCRLLIGHKNALYYCAQSANSFSSVLFVSSYTTAIVSPHLPRSFTKLVRTRETFIFYFPNQKRRNYR